MQRNVARYAEKAKPAVTAVSVKQNPAMWGQVAPVMANLVSGPRW